MSSVTVVFEVWGARCTTQFDSLTAALWWLRIAVNKHNIEPVGVTTTNSATIESITYNSKQLYAMIDEDGINRDTR